MRSFLCRFSDDTSGVSAIEYALVGSLIAIAITSAVGLVSQSLLAVFQQVQGVFAA